MADDGGGYVCGIVVGAFDMMIVAHAIAAKTTLLAHNKTFNLIPDELVALDDWSSKSCPPRLPRAKKFLGYSWLA